MHSLQAVSRNLERYDVLRLGTFLTLSNSELDFLAFNQGFETRAGDGTEVVEYVGARFSLDKAKAFRFIEPFNGSCSCRHMYNLLFQD